jgi:DNA-directed RNA polymerase specialized sigma24 family protein
LKRGGTRKVDEHALQADESSAGFGLDQVPAPALAPELNAACAEEIHRLFGLLPDETLRLVALLKLEGHSNEQAAASLDCGLRTIERKLELIRKLWEREL